MGALLCVWLCARKHSCFTKKTGSSLGDCWLLFEILSHFSLWKTLTGSTSLFWLTTLFESCQDPCLLFEAKDCVCYLSLPYEQWALCIISSYPCFLSATLHHRPIHVQYNWTQNVISQAWVEWLASSRDTPEEVISKTEHGSSWLPFLKNWVLQSWLLLAADSPTAPQPWTHCVSVGLESCCSPSPANLHRPGEPFGHRGCSLFTFPPCVLMQTHSKLTQPLFLLFSLDLCLAFVNISLADTILTFKV